MSSLDTSKDFISNSNYLNQLAKEVNKADLDSMDSNLLYEVAYANTYLKDLLKKDSSISCELKEIKSVFDEVLALTHYDSLSSLDNTDNHKKILKAKYDNVNDGSYDKKYEVLDSDYGVHNYIKRKLPSLCIFIALLGLFSSGVFINCIYSIFGVNTSEQLLQVENMLTLVLSTLFTIITVITGASICIDLVYISFPSFRCILKDKVKTSLVSSSALESVEECMNSTVRYKVVKDYDRIERNKAWLEDMLSNTNNIQNDMLISELNSVKTALDDYESREKDRDYFTLFAKIEFLHNIYLSSI